MSDFLLKNYLDKSSLKQAPTRDGFGVGLVAAATTDKNIYAVCADLTESTRMQGFKEVFPERFVQFGIAEQALAAAAAGMALAGKNIFITSYAAFSPGRNWEQIRTTLCLQKTNVKVIGSHAGVSVGPDGATHQMLEDIAIMRTLPNMIVLSPADSNEAAAVTLAAAQHNGPVYIRLGREKTPIFTAEKQVFKIGEAKILTKGKDLAIFATGPLVYEALQAAAELEKDGVTVQVINIASIKPLDESTIIQAARECGAALTLEEGQIAGGMGSAVCELLAENHPIPIIRMGMMDRFGESGEPQELLEYFKLTSPHIIKNAHAVLKRK